jgi:heme-degrading monooxygenase HmoA
MIARVWRGRIRASDLQAYATYIDSTGIVDYKSTPGNRGAYFLSHVDGDEAHVVTLSFWDSLASIRAFAGDDVTLARYYPRDREYLLDFPERVEHFEVFDVLHDA